MPITANGKDFMLDALFRNTLGADDVTHIGALQADTAQTGVTSVASTDIFTKTAHGFAAGDLVIFTALTGGTGLKLNYPYFVIAGNLAANTFQISEKPAGASVDHTTNVTAGTVQRFVELTGGSPAYARKTIAFNAASFGSIDDSTNGAVIDVPAAGKVSALGLYSAVTAGTLQVFDLVTEETFAAQGTYTVTDVDIDLLLADG